MKVITVNAETGERVYSRKEVARVCGVSTQTLALWEEAGKIPASDRDENDYRYWTEEELEAIKQYTALPRKDKYVRKSQTNKNTERS